MPIFIGLKLFLSIHKLTSKNRFRNDKMGPNSTEISAAASTPANSNEPELRSPDKDEQMDRTPDPRPDLLDVPFVTPSSLQIDPDLVPVAPALILNALALTPVDRTGSRSPAIRKRSSTWIQNENSFPVDGFVPFDPKFSFSASKFPKPFWPKTAPTIPTSFFKDHRSKKKVRSEHTESGKQRILLRIG